MVVQYEARIERSEILETCFKLRPRISLRSIRATRLDCFGNNRGNLIGFLDHLLLIFTFDHDSYHRLGP